MKTKLKRCSRCKKFLPISEFGKNKSEKDRLHYVCKTCRRKYDEKHYNESKKIMHNLKINGCAICGYNKCDAALNFHHVNPKDKKFSLMIASMNRSNKNILEEINKCILMCCNCHKEIHTKEKIEKEMK